MVLGRGQQLLLVGCWQLWWLHRPPGLPQKNTNWWCRVGKISRWLRLLPGEVGDICTHWSIDPFFTRDISLTGRTTSQTRSARAVTCTLRRTCLLQSEPKEIHFLDGNESFRYAMTTNGQNKHMIDQLMCKVRLKCVCICLLMIFNAWLKARLMKPCPRSIYSDVSQFRSRLLEKKSQPDCRERSQNDKKKLPHSQDRWWGEYLSHLRVLQMYWQIDIEIHRRHREFGWAKLRPIKLGDSLH